MLEKNYVMFGMMHAGSRQRLARGSPDIGGGEQERNACGPALLSLPLLTPATGGAPACN